MAEPERDGTRWYGCEDCRLMFEDREEAGTHGTACDAGESSYIR